MNGERGQEGNREADGLVDVVIVSYNSRERLRACIEPLAAAPFVHTIVVDNASRDDSLATVRDLRASLVRLGENRGFAHGCNAGWRRGRAPFVLFLNPDARIEASSVIHLVEALRNDDAVGLVGPRLVNVRGDLEFSQRRYPRLRSTYSRALFLHRLFPMANWSDEIVRNRDAYAAPRSVEWISGACVLIRRQVLERLGGWDEGFFLYCEDMDLCKRIREAGFDVRYEPSAVAEHIGGMSAPRASLYPVLAASQIRYARKHRSAPVAFLERAGLGLSALTHFAVGRGGRMARAGHARSLRFLFAGKA